MTMCSGTSWKTKQCVANWNVILTPSMGSECGALVTSCSVMLMSSSCCRNCSNMYLGAMSTRDWKETRHYVRDARERKLNDDKRCSEMSRYKMEAFTCLADGVMPIWTTMMARVMFSSCILWQYILIVLIPTLGSSEKWRKIRCINSTPPHVQV